MVVAALEGKVEAACRLARALADSAGDSIDSLYVAGSLTAGLGNRTSDADLFALHRAGSAFGDEETQYNVDGHRVDVTRYVVDHAWELVDAVTSFEVRRKELTALHGLQGKLDFVVRLHTSSTVLDSPALQELRRRVSESIDSVRRTAVNFFAIAVNGHLEDFLGAALDGDFDTAALMGQELVGYAGKAVAAASGDVYIPRKWVYKQLRRTPVRGFPIERFIELQRGGWTSRGEAGAGALVFFAQTCVAVSQLLGGLRLSLDAWPAWTGDSSDSGLWRNAAYTMLRQSDGLLLHWELRKQLLLREPVAFVWALCDGSSPDVIVANVERLAGQVPALRTLTADRVRTILGALQDRELVAPRPFPLSSLV